MLPAANSLKAEGLPLGGGQGHPQLSAGALVCKAWGEWGLHVGAQVLGTSCNNARGTRASCIRAGGGFLYFAGGGQGALHMGTRGTRVSCTGFRMLLHVCAGGTRSLHSGAREVLHVGARGTRASRVGAWKGLHICARGLRAYGMLVSGAQGRQASVLGSSSVPGSVCTSVPGHEGIVHQCQGTFAGQGSLCVGARELLHHVGARGTRVSCVSAGGLLCVTAGDTRALHVGDGAQGCGAKREGGSAKGAVRQGLTPPHHLHRSAAAWGTCPAPSCPR